MNPPTPPEIPFPEHKLRAFTDKVYQIGDLLQAACERRLLWPEAIRHIRPAAKKLVRSIEEFDHMHREYIALIDSEPFSRAKLDIIDPSRESEVDRWRATLEPLFDQLSANSIVFEHTSELYHDEVYHPFLELHRRHPDHQLWNLSNCLTKVDFAVQELCDMAEESMLWTRSIHSQYMAYKQAAQIAARPLEPEPNPLSPNEADDDYSSTAATNFASKGGDLTASPGWSADQCRTAALALQPKPANSGPALTTSFGAVEEQVNRGHTHKRAATMMTAEYMLEYDTVGPPRFGSVFRRNKNIPRIFTGSSSELEQSIRKMQIAEADILSSREAKKTYTGVVAKEIAKQPASSPPMGNRHRAENRETINDVGQDVEARKPRARFHGDRIRARTMSGTLGGLEAWLNE
ncbi:Hypothetical predicted protein [Lecanosticta acicola]|uniref:Uncharacterized protein n=1 Tax=Lecanosticta acicola TaxID=111012 RepID=A0AAI9EBA6_9PEZI|nr:Hypothetical predicted protein [Lecanosticta acicola]